MKEDTKRIIRSAYGRDYSIQFQFGTDDEIDENVDLESFQQQIDCQVTLIVEVQRLTETELEKEARRLYRVYTKLKEKDYQLKTIRYHYPKWSSTRTRNHLEAEIGELSLVEDAQQLLRDAMEAERERELS